MARMGEKRNAYKFVFFFAGGGNPEGRRPLGRPRRRCEDNIKMELKEIGLGGMDRINLA
jgi:hypothetical protein